MIETDEQLMIKVSHGDQKAFEVLFFRYKNRLYSYIFRFSGDAQLTEDIFQETFLRLYRYSPQYKPLAKFSTFIYRIATNLCINEMKRRKKVPTLFFRKAGDNRRNSINVEEEMIPGKDLLPDDQLYAQELTKYLNQALDLLPANMRATLLLSELEGKKYEEIATILGCSVGTVKSRVNRSRAKILKYFEDNEIL